VCICTCTYCFTAIVNGLLSGQLGNKPFLLLLKAIDHSRLFHLEHTRYLDDLEDG